MEKIKGKRRRIWGGWAEFSAPFIAKLIGRSLRHTKNLLYTYGTAKSNTFTIEELRRLIWLETTKRRITELRGNVKKGLDSGELLDTSWLQSDLADPLGGE